MASEDSLNKFSSNLKVPPLKIVLNSHQNNTVMNVSKVSEDKYDKTGGNREEDESEDNLTEHRKESSTSSSNKRSNSDLMSAEVGNSADGGEKAQTNSRKGYRGNSDSDNLNNHPTTARKMTDEFLMSSSSSNSSSSGSSIASDPRSASTSPSSESESFASNSTIIAEQHSTYQRRSSKFDHKDGGTTSSSTSVSKQDRISRNNSSKSTANDRSNNNNHQDSGTTPVSGKRSHESNTSESEPASGNSNQHVSNNNSTRETSSNANQRITRSSQRAALQNKTENQSDSVADDADATKDTQEKTSEGARKVKRRKGEPQESETDANQSTNQPPVMANICPADYQLPSQNSFELYRDIRERPYKKMLELNNIHPKVPQGFKDYLLNAGPYLLDGNKLGIGLNGPKYEYMGQNGRNPIHGPPASTSGTKLSTSFQRKYLAQQPIHKQRYSAYNIPKLCDTPKSLVIGSPLHELFVEQERARQQMRMQHLKERERSVLAVEQEILRAYNNAAIANAGQKLHLSACTYFYYQERYHYIDDKTNPNGKSNGNEVPHSQDNSFLCIEGKETTKPVNGNGGQHDSTEIMKDSHDKEQADSGNVSNKDDKPNDASTVKVKQEAFEVKSSAVAKDSASKTTSGINTLESGDARAAGDTIVDGKRATSEKAANPNDSDETTKTSDIDNNKQDDTQKMESESNNMANGTSEDTKDLNRKVFLEQLQAVDDKWAKIKQEMWIRHKNEADSLYAVQSLEWEWKVKEIGACDVRIPMKVEPEFVPRVEVLALDY